MTDKNEIIRALRLWFQSGDVFEVRVLDAVTAEWMRPHMESGYFDYEHIPDAADAIGKLRSYRGAYATVNPVNPDLLARACNRTDGVPRFRLHRLRHRRRAVARPVSFDFFGPHEEHRAHS